MGRILGRSQTLFSSPLLSQRHRLYGTSAAKIRTTAQSDTEKLKDTQEVRAQNRLPIIINGAGPAGLIVAIRLKNANIPFEIFEKHEQDLPSKLRRNYVSHLSIGRLGALQKMLGYSSRQKLLGRISNDRFRDMSRIQQSTPIHTEALMQLLREQVPVHYGHTLEHHAISCRASVITSQYLAGHLVRTFQACLIVGADGKYSAVKPKACRWAWPAITYVSNLVVPKQLFKSDYKSEQLLREGEITHLFGNTRLMLGYKGSRNNDVFLSLWYSRMITSEEDYRAFYGTSIREKPTTRPDFQFDPMIAAEIESLQPLPDPFEKAYARCKASSVSQKISLNCVMGVAYSPRYEEIVRDNISLPAVMIGDAAHGLPDSFSSDSINGTVADAFTLSRMILQRYDNDSAFTSISADFYERERDVWGWLPRMWAEKWMKAHGFDLKTLRGWNGFTFDHRSYWEKQSAPGRLPDHSVQRKLESKDIDSGISRFMENEEERWKKVEQRMRSNWQRQMAYKREPGAQKAKIVVQYLDSRRQESVDTGKHPSQNSDQAPSNLRNHRQGHTTISK